MTAVPAQTAPVQTPAGRTTQITFRALLGALSRPGNVQPLPPGDELALIAAALLDVQVTAYSPGEGVQAVLQATGAVNAPPDQAEYLFFTDWDEEARSALRQAHLGTARDPHLAATLILSARLGVGPEWLLSGPGVDGEQSVRFECPGEVLARRQDFLFPLGWDLLLVGESEVVGLPRTTRVRAGSR